MVLWRTHDWLIRLLALFVASMLFAADASARNSAGESHLDPDQPDVDFVVPAAPPVLDENCVVAILNRVAQVRPDGTWILDNVPTNFGLIRARATCVVDGITRAGQSDPFLVPTNGVITVGDIFFDQLEPVPESILVATTNPNLGAPGETTQLEVQALFPGGTSENVTNDPDTSYLGTNDAVATVNEGGLVTAVGSGAVLVRVLHEAISAFIRIEVSLSGTDGDGDGIPDDVELANGLNPNDPVDGFEDFDGDGLTNKEELIDFLTDFTNPDSDGDGIDDGEEVEPGDDGFVTNPLLVDTDGDGVSDALEIATGSDPTDPGSLNLAAALTSIEVAPDAFTVTVNTILLEASRPLVVTGNLVDGNTIDLTSTALGTSYASSDLLVCNFGGQDGRVFASQDGGCTITITNSGFSTEASGVVTTFAPTALSFVSLPGLANSVDVSGELAYVAAGSAGLQVVDVSDRAAPQIVGSYDTPGDARDVKVVADVAFVADGASGLQVVDVSDPLLPSGLGSVLLDGPANDVSVQDNFAYVAAGAGDLQIVDVSDPSTPEPVASRTLGGSASGVDVGGGFAAVAAGTSGVHIVDVSDPTAPAFVSTVPGGIVNDVAVSGATVLVADSSTSFRAIDITNPASPTASPGTDRTLGGLLADVAASGRFALGADIFFVNGVPIIDVSDPANPLPRAILDFSGFRDDDGRGIATDASFVYLTAAVGSSSRLYIGQYLQVVDDAGVAPDVEIVSPAQGEVFVEGSILPILAEASDDVGVAAVEFLVDGAVVATDTGEPYQISLPVPAGVSALELGAEAIDFGPPNRGTAPTVVVSVIPDPLTTVVGTVLAPGGTPVEGADVTVRDLATTTDAAGAFQIANVPTIVSTLRATATAEIDGNTLRGRSASLAPVRGGITDLGTIQLGTAGLLVVVNDEWTLSNTGFANSPDAATFVLNIAERFGAGGPAAIHAYSTSFGYTQSVLNQTLTAAGHTYTTGFGVPFELDQLLEFDGIFVGGNLLSPAQVQMLTEYVDLGGNVYLSAGHAGGSGEPNTWNPFLTAFGIQLAPNVNGIGGNIDVSGATHPVFDGVSTLYQNNGHSMSGEGIEVFFNGQGLYAVSDGKSSNP